MKAVTICVLLAGIALSSALDARASEASAPSPDAAPEETFIEQYTATYKFRLGNPTRVRVAPGGTSVFFVRTGPRSFEGKLFEFDVAAGSEREILSAATLLGGGEEHLTPEELARRERMRSSTRGIASYELSRDGTKILVPLSGSLFVFDRGTGKTREYTPDAGYAIDPQLSPDGARVAFASGADLHVVDLATGEQRRLTTSGDPAVTHGVAEFVAQEEMDRYHGYWWSPGGTWLAYQRNDTRDVESMYIMDPRNPARPPQSWKYPRAGQANADVRLGIVPATGGETVWVEWDRTAYPYLARVVWQPNAPLTLVVQNRRQTEEVVLAVDRDSGQTRALMVEKDPAWLNLNRARYAPTKLLHWSDDGTSFLWLTERSGAWQIERRDASGKRVGVVTEPGIGLRGLLHVDEARGEAFVTASTDPAQTHLWAVPLDPAGGEPRRLSDAPGEYTAVFPSGGSRFVRTQTTLDTSMRWTVHAPDGRELGTLRSVAEAPPFRPAVELAVVGQRELRAAVVRPRDFEPGKRYPVIVQVYGGPGGRMVSHRGTRYLLSQWIADQGFVVVSIDGRGTPARGREWERAIAGNFIEVPLEDQVDGLKALGARFPEMDLTRVGIEGGSFGGFFAAMAVLQRPEVYHAAYAEALVADWRDYDSHYTERYLGLPEENADGYLKSNVLTYAPHLIRPLLMAHGTADDNVYLVHSLKLADALLRADRPYEFLPLSGAAHGVRDPALALGLHMRMIEFFHRHLTARP